MKNLVLITLLALISISSIPAQQQVDFNKVNNYFEKQREQMKSYGTDGYLSKRLTKEDKVSMKEEALRLYGKIKNEPSFQKEEWLTSFKKEFEKIKEHGVTNFSIQVPMVFENSPKKKKLAEIENFSIFSKKVTNFTIEIYPHPKVKIPEGYLMEVCFELNGKKFSWFDWEYIPEKYHHLLPKNN